MKYRDALVFPAEDLGASGTKVIDLNINQKVSRLEMTYKTTKGAQTMSYGTPANISRIELVDGSSRLHSLTGYENQALAYYSRPNICMDQGQHIMNLSETDMYVIDFGRWLWDTELAFDPARFINPQLRITFNEATSTATSTAGILEIWARMFDEKEINPIGFLSAIEHYSYTHGAGDSYEQIELPQDKPVRQMLVRADQAGFEPWYSMDEVRFDESTLNKIAFEYTDMEMYYRRMKAHWPLITAQIAVAPGATGETYYVPVTDYYAGMSFMGQGGTEEVYVTAASGRGGQLALDSTATNNILGVLFGYLPWHCFQFPMGLKDEIDDWYDPAGKKPRLRLRVNTTGGTGQVVLEELQRY